MFVDRAKIWVKGGDGGNGCVSFRREKHVPRGGPDGGDGGNGGSVFLHATSSLSTLLDFTRSTHFRAPKGRHGQGSKFHGKSGNDLNIRVPAGTVVRDRDHGHILKDLKEDTDSVCIAKGGRGGRGNKRFATATNQTPRYAEDGSPGEERAIELELRLIADAALIGFPNAGKSTLLSRVSAAHPKVAEYPFTTLVPQLGIVDLNDYRRFTLAEIPGLIRGAHEGKGLGDEFLRHIRRTKILCHVIDMGPGADPPTDAFSALRDEVRLYDHELSLKPFVVAANKMDLPGSQEKLQDLTRAFPDIRIFPISAVKSQGLGPLLNALYTILNPSD
jgi:GTP-binding protein